jgi:hypothetical protein
MLASGGQDGTVRLWEVASGKMRRKLEQGGDVVAVAFSPDDRTLASASLASNTVRLWEVANGKSRGQLEGHQSSIFRLAFSRDGKRLVSGSQDHTALVWDMTRAAAQAREREALDPADVEECWKTLAKSDGEEAYAAVVRLAQAAPEKTLPVLARHLAARPAEARRFARLIADLDHDEFDVREKATEVLEKVGMPALSELRRAMKSSPSVEVRRRAEMVLAKLDADDWVPPEELRLLRTVEVLERVGTAEARKLLEDLARGSSVVEEARAALARLRG